MKTAKNGDAFVMHPETGLDHILCEAIALGVPVASLVQIVDGQPVGNRGVPFSELLRIQKEETAPYTDCAAQRSVA